MNNENLAVIKGKLIEVKRDVPYDFEGRSGKSASVTIRAGGLLLKFPVQNTNGEMLDEAEGLLDKDVKLQFEVFAGQFLRASVRAVAIE